MSVEQKNFVKISWIVLDIFSKYLRKLFKRLWDKKYPEEEWCSGNESQVLYNKLKNDVIKRAKGKGILEKLKNGNDQKWDVTTLVFALLDTKLELTDSCRERKDWNLPLLESEQIRTLGDIRNGVFGHPESMSCSSDVLEQTISQSKKLVESLFSEDAEDAIQEIDEIATKRIETGDFVKLKQKLKGKLKQFSAGKPLLLVPPYNACSLCKFYI